MYDTDRSGKLRRVEFGNGKKVHYEYDEFDRVTSTRYDAETTPRYEYEYGANGAVGRVTDNNLSVVTDTEYDLANRPIRVTQRDQSTGALQYQTTLDYDKCHIAGCSHTSTDHCSSNAKNNLTQFAEKLSGGATYKTAYKYDNGIKYTCLHNIQGESPHPNGLTEAGKSGILRGRGVRRRREENGRVPDGESEEEGFMDYGRGGVRAV